MSRVKIDFFKNLNLRFSSNLQYQAAYLVRGFKKNQAHFIELTHRPVQASSFFFKAVKLLRLTSLVNGVLLLALLLGLLEGESEGVSLPLFRDGLLLGVVLLFCFGVFLAEAGDSLLRNLWFKRALLGVPLDMEPSLKSVPSCALFTISSARSINWRKKSLGFLLYHIKDGLERFRLIVYSGNFLFDYCWVPFFMAFVV